MIRYTLVSVIAAAALALIGAAPSFAAQPYPLNFKNFALGSPESTSGTAFSGGAVTLASSGTGSFTYTDPFANYSGDNVDGSGTYVSGTWTSSVTRLFPFNELVAS